MGYMEPDLYIAQRDEDRWQEIEDRRAEYVRHREHELRQILDGRSRFHYQVRPIYAHSTGGDVYILTDMAAWVAEYRDVESVVCALLMDRRDDLFGDYALERARAEADREVTE